MPPPLILDPASLDLTRVVADREAIRLVNPQRYDMEQLTAIVHVDREQELIAGYKDVCANEFWVRGHMPGEPLFPGVLICEAAAQLCSYYIVTAGRLAVGEFLGFGGLEEVKFRDRVLIGDRLVLIGKAIKVHRRQTVFSVQGFVGARMVFHGDVIGMPLKQGESAAEE